MNKSMNHDWHVETWNWVDVKLLISKSLSVRNTWDQMFYRLSTWMLVVVFILFLAFDFCRFCVVIRFFNPRHNGQWPPTLKDFCTRYYPLHYFLILIIEKEPEILFLMFSAKQGNYWCRFITSLVWRGPWLVIEPGTSRTRSQHSTIRLS